MARTRRANVHTIRSSTRSGARYGRSTWGNLAALAAAAMRPRRQRTVRTVSIAPKPQRKRAPARRSRYHTVGHLGRRFARGKKHSPGLFMKRGVVFSTEAGGVFSNSDCVYFGHSLAVYDIILCASRAMIRKLFQNAGYDVTDMSAKVYGPIASTHGLPALGLVYGTDNDIPSTSLFPPSDVATTFVDYGNWLQGQWFALYSGSFKLYSIRLSSGGTSSVYSATLNLSGAMLKFDCRGDATLQNRTLATNAGAGIDQNKNDVANNPIAGKVYSKSGNSFPLRYADNTASAGVLTANSLNGIFSFDSGAVGVTPAEANIMRRPPSKSAFAGCRHSGPVRLNPGQMKSSTVKWVKSMTVNNFIRSVDKVLEGGGSLTNVRLNLGEAKLYAFEKRCNTTIDEPLMSLGYEYNCTYKCVVVPSVAPIAVATYLK